MGYFILKKGEIMTDFIHKIGFRKAKWILIIITVALSILFVISLFLAIKGYIEFKSVDMLTM